MVRSWTNPWPCRVWAGRLPPSITYGVSPDFAMAHRSPWVTRRLAQHTTCSHNGYSLCLTRQASRATAVESGSLWILAHQETIQTPPSNGTMSQTYSHLAGLIRSILCYTRCRWQEMIPPSRALWGPPTCRTAPLYYGINIDRQQAIPHQPPVFSQISPSQ